MAKFIFTVFILNMQINFTLTKFNTANSFGCNTAVQNLVLHTLEDVPRLTCAKCGHELLTRGEYSDFLNGLKIPVIEALENPILKPLRETRLFKFFTEKAQENPTSRSIINLRKKVAIPHEELDIFYKIADTCETSFRKSSESIVLFKKTMPYLNNNEQKVVKTLEALSEKYPNETFEQILKKEEVIGKYLTIKEKSLEKHKTACNVIFDKMKKLLGEIPSENEAILTQTNERAISISAGKQDKTMKKYLLGEIYKDIMSLVETPSEREKFAELTKSIPLLEVTPERIIADYAGKNDIAIMKSLLSNSHSQYTQIIQRVENNGSRPIENGIQMCLKCHAERKKLSLEKLGELYPEFVKNLQNQIDRIISFVAGKQLPEYKNYPSNVKKILSEASGGKLNISLKKLNDSIIGMKALEKKMFSNVMGKKESDATILTNIKTIENHIKKLNESPLENMSEISTYEILLHVYKKKWADTLHRRHPHRK